MERRSDAGTPGLVPWCSVPSSIAPPNQPPCASPAVSPASLGSAPVPAGRGVVFSRNRYGQVTMTSQPTNESELQLYRVLQHANLLTYYDTFISQGGDDVQQLCEAGEEEFLEIMALVGMASKPLHVRRLQKALQEWISSPRRFQLPILPVPVPVVPTPGFLPARPGGMGVAREGPASAPPAARPPSPPTPPAAAAAVPAASVASAAAAPPAAPSPAPSLGRDRDGAPSPSHSQDSRDRDPLSWGPGREDGGGGDSYPSSGSPQLPTPVLLDSQIQRLADSAERVAKTLPSFEPRAQNSKKKACKELELTIYDLRQQQVMSMAADDPKRPEKFREFAAIYGRFDCKRKAEKPLTLHEVSVNEAAAQICMQIPALLTRRDELFPLARQVVRHSGYQYSKGHSRSQGAQGFSPREFPSSEEYSGKRPRLDSDSQSDDLRDSEWCRRQDRLEQIADELRQLRDQGEELQGAARRLEASRGDPQTIAALQHQLDGLQDREHHLVTEQHSLVSLNKQLYKSSMDFEDDDSQFSMGSIPSPSEAGGDGSKPDTESGNGIRDRQGAAKSEGASSPPSGVTVVPSALSSAVSVAPVLLPNQVIASSTGAIIAVANPALTLSAVSQPLSLVTHTKFERVKSEITATRVKTEPTFSSATRPNGRGRLAD